MIYRCLIQVKKKVYYTAKQKPGNTPLNHAVSEH